MKTKRNGVSAIIGRNLKILLTLGSLLLTINVYATPVVQGVDYTIATNPVPSTVPAGKIDIKEFFSFTCIHCKDVEPLVEASITNNKKVSLERIQVPWDPKTTELAKLNATYQMLNLERLYTPTFNAIFAGQDLTDPKVLTAFLKQNKVNVKSFMNTYNSFDISTAAGRYKNLMTAYKVEGTPTFVVANKYILKPAQPARIIEVLQYLIKQQKVK